MSYVHNGRELEMEEKQQSLLVLLFSLSFSLPARLQSDAAKSKFLQCHVCLLSRRAPSSCGCVSLCIQINNLPCRESKGPRHLSGAVRVEFVLYCVKREETLAFEPVFVQTALAICAVASSRDTRCP